MKTKTIITDLSHDDLVDLFSTALYGSYVFGCVYDSVEYHALPNAEDNDCYEDALAKLLLAGKSIEIIDKQSEDKDDHYGNLKHKWDDEDEVMVYTITLIDIIEGLQKTLDCDDEWILMCVHNFATQNGNFDLYQAEALLQYIIFGEVIYG